MQRASRGAFLGLMFMASLMTSALSLTTIAQAQGQFVATGSMSTPRTRHIAVPLQDGRVLVAGGDDYYGNGTASAEIYDPSSGSWSTTSSMNYARFGHSAVRLQDGRVLVIGGVSSNVCTSPPVSNSAEIYDPTNGTWTLTANMNVSRRGATAVVMTDGRVIVAGGGNRCGSVYASAEIYDPISNTWTLTGSMNQVREDASGILLSDGEVLVAGGSGVPTGIPTLASAEIYNPASETWIVTGSMNSARLISNYDMTPSNGLVPLPSGQILTVGGFIHDLTTNTVTYLASAESYDPSSGSWTSTGSMASSRAGHQSTLLASGKVLVTGGVNSIFLNTAEIYDPAAGAFSSAGTMTSPRCFHTATLLASGQVLIAGGSSDSNALTSCELFIPSSSKLTAFKITPATVPGSISTTGTVTISSTAPSGGVVVSLSNTNGAAQVPGSVIVPAGATSASFTISTTAVTTTQTGVVTASCGGVTRSVTLKVRPIGIKSVTVFPNPILGGYNTIGIVTLEAPAAPGDITATLASSNPSVASPDASVTIPAGEINGCFNINTSAVSSITYVTISATANGIKKSKTLKILP